MNMKKTLVLLLAAAAVFSPLRSQEVPGSHYDSVLRRIMEDDQRYAGNSTATHGREPT